MDQDTPGSRRSPGRGPVDRRRAPGGRLSARARL